MRGNRTAATAEQAEPETRHPVTVVMAVRVGCYTAMGETVGLLVLIAMALAVMVAPQDCSATTAATAGVAVRAAWAGYCTATRDQKG
ncbi:hypothetical protein LAUMK41_00003 [Mycobacterium attenuatum]|nr:hypothetical protein LAUMK41_00003 [Mycobacterium attenuatum]